MAQHRIEFIAPVEGMELPSITDPIPGTPQYDKALVRDVTTRDISAMPWLPQGPDAWATEIYDQIEESERKFAAPHLLQEDYREGTATVPDEVAEVHGAENGHLFSAEHATMPISVLTGKHRFPDAGTAGLSALLAENYGTAVMIRGKQTTNVPSVEEHPLKERLAVHLPTARSFMSIHGKAYGMFVHPDDPCEVQAIIGLGADPTEDMRSFAQSVAQSGRDELGLYVIVGNDQPYYLQRHGKVTVKRNDDGEPYSSRLAALKPTMTTNFARSILNQTHNTVPAMQVELTNLLRLTPTDKYPKDRKSLIMGVALGYKLLEMMVRMAETHKLESV